MSKKTSPGITFVSIIIVALALSLFMNYTLLLERQKLRTNAKQLAAINTKLKHQINKLSSEPRKPLLIDKQNKQIYNSIKQYVAKYALYKDPKYVKIITDAFYNEYIKNSDKFLVLYSLAIATVESTLNIYAKSGAGAIGLMQVMPMHHKKVWELFNPNLNVHVGVSLLKKYISDTKSVKNGIYKYLGTKSPRYFNKVNQYFVSLMQIIYTNVGKRSDNNA